MKRRKAVSPIKLMHSRSLAWATRLRQRYVRFADCSRLSMLLYLPALARTLISLQQHWLTSSIKVHPQLNLSLNQKHVVNTWTNNLNAPQMTLLNLISLVNLGAPAATHELEKSSLSRRSAAFEEVRRTRHLRDYENHQHLALTLALDRTSSDLSTSLSRKFGVQRQAQVREVATLLTQRVKRISEPAAGHTPMSFRAPVTNRTPAAEAVAATRSRDAFEKRSLPPTMPSIAPPTLNVEHLTSEVMKQIDRRLIARRERMGQI